MTVVVDYDAGNIRSVEKAFQYIGEDTVLTRDYHILKQADRVVLPGVGSFGDAMEKLERYDLISPIQEIVDAKVPFLGICLGLQLLFRSSDESSGVKGLSLVDGEIVRIPDKEGLKIPHMGWNNISIKPGARLFEGIQGDPYVYFVHSYYLKADHREEVAATTQYSVTIDASIEKNNLFACQFHPEKSGDVGLQILRNFANMGKEDF
ncbi:MAG: imidazole glycerol phosphate synthase subunit HisH [Clostridiales bacterium]|nr:imidazole glycerol phosphate synthase subunit HisH [Clostridiales bacterium]